MLRWIVSALFVGSAIGCAAVEPPTDTASAAAHDRVAALEEAAASRLAAQGEPQRSYLTCAEPGHEDRPCWRLLAGDAAELERRRDAAARHRAASRELRLAEAKACTGLPPEARDVDPFAQTGDILDVSEIFAPEPRLRDGQLRGARVTFGPVTNLTATLLQRMIDCHIARAAALGRDASEAPRSPLVLAGVRGRVVGVQGRLAVELVTDDVATAAEVLRRARWLVTP